MFDLGWSELLIIGVVALIVIGPKDLPEMFRTLGRFTAKAKSMAREFSRAMEAAADESGVKDVAKDLKTMTSAKSMGLDAVKSAATKFESWDPMAKSRPLPRQLQLPRPPQPKPPPLRKTKAPPPRHWPKRRPPNGPNVPPQLPTKAAKSDRAAKPAAVKARAEAQARDKGSKTRCQSDTAKTTPPKLRRQKPPPKPAGQTRAQSRCKKG